jgi:two-component system, chemotaxis family, protein-glutamate methylesterase/glutaminase
MVPAKLGDRGLRKIEAIVIGGSAGSVSVLERILPGLPSRFPAVLIAVHVLPSSPSLLAQIFSPRCQLRVREAEAFEAIEPGTVYFAPADYHFLVEPDRRCALSIGPPVHFSRPAIDMLFESAAEAYGPSLAGLVLTGASDDGARGLRAIQEAGGLTWVQSPETAESTRMPLAALHAVPLARRIPLSGILSELRALGETP